MQFKLILATTAVLILTAAGQAVTTTWEGDWSSSWTESRNWNNGVPSTSDTAVIPDVTGPNVDPILATDATIAVLQINSGGVLTVDASSGTAELVVTATDGAPIAGTLNIASDGDVELSGSSSLALASTGSIGISNGGVFTLSGPGAQDVDGTINVSGAFEFSGSGTLDIDSTVTLTSTGAFYASNSGTFLVDTTGIFDVDGDVYLTGGPTATFNGTLYLAAGGASFNIQNNSVTFNGSGQMVGENDSAQLTVASGLTLTNQTNIEGRMTIQGPGTLDNDDTVIANAAGVLTLGSSLILSPSSTGDWQAAGDPGAVLQFDRAHSGGGYMGGDFLIDDCAIIHLNNVSVSTSGTFIGNAGFMTVTGTPEFHYGCPSSCTEVPAEPDELPVEFGDCD